MFPLKTKVPFNSVLFSSADLVLEPPCIWDIIRKEM
jgi:hypothetical protein